LPCKGSKTDWEAQAGGQARPSRARRVQDRPVGGILSQVALSKPKSVAGGLKGGSGDDGLDGVLGEIELRVGRDRQDGGALAHVPEKWKPVFRTEHAQNQRIQD
jgi:hypothetical protein